MTLTTQPVTDDVRQVLPRLRAAGDLTMDVVPWSRFDHFYGPGDEVPAMLAALAEPDPERAERALWDLWSKTRHQGVNEAVIALAVPFLLRTAADHGVRNRPEILFLAAEAGHRNHYGRAVRGDLFQVSDDPDEPTVDRSGRPVGWSQQAAREAVSASSSLLIYLLGDDDRLVRANAAYALAGAITPPACVRSELRARLARETSPTVRMSLVLALAQLAVVHGDPDVQAWTRALWSDDARPLDVRFAAALSWLCATADPVPVEMRFLFHSVLGTDLERWMAEVPWADDLPRLGLLRWLTTFLDEGSPGR
jgi:hypothetical protein